MYQKKLSKNYRKLMKIDENLLNHGEKSIKINKKINFSTNKTNLKEKCKTSNNRFPTVP